MSLRIFCRLDKRRPLECIYNTVIYRRSCSTLASIHPSTDALDIDKRLDKIKNELKERHENRNIERSLFFQQKISPDSADPDKDGLIENQARSSLKAYSSYIDFVKKSKEKARCSFVIEDLTPDSFVWGQESDSIKSHLFPKLSPEQVNIWRWKIGERTSVKGKKFLLFEFDKIETLQKCILDMKRNFGISSHDRVLFIRKQDVHSWKQLFQSYADKPSRPTIAENSAPTSSIIAGNLENKQSEKTPFEIPFESYPTFDPFTKLNMSNTKKPLKGPMKSQSAEIENNLQTVRKAIEFQESISELQFKVQFFIIHQIEQIIRKNCLMEKYASKNGTENGFRMKTDTSILENLELVPFGSDVSGVGNEDSDMDLCFISNNPDAPEMKNNQPVMILNSVSIMLAKAVKVASPHKEQLPRHLTAAQWNNSIFKHYDNINRVFKAFVPIIKCRSRLLPDKNIDISVNFSRNSGVDMSQYMFACTVLGDPRVKPFLLLLKFWAKHHNIIKPYPEHGFKTFQITMLGVAFLQQQKIIPSIKDYMVDPHMILSLNPKQSGNVQMDDIYDMLGKFFKFVLEYDFWTKVIDIWHGKINQTKEAKQLSERNTCYIQNPFNTTLNICSAVKEVEVESFLSYCRQTNDVMKGNNFQPEQLFLKPRSRMPKRAY